MALENEEQVCCGADCLSDTFVCSGGAEIQWRQKKCFVDAINIKCACLRGENYTDDLEGEYVKETLLKIAAEIKKKTNKKNK